MAASCLEFSADGSLYAVADSTGVSVHLSSTHACKIRVDCPGVQAIAFSPRATFLLTFQRPTKGSDGIMERNLKVWSVTTGGEELALHQKAFSRDAWPSVKFTQDDRIATHMVTNTLHVYTTANWGTGPTLKFPVKGIAGFAISPAAPASGTLPTVAVYVPESKGSPGHIALYRLTDAKPDAGSAPVARRSFFRANSVRFFWASTGSAVLALTAADVDATNQSYYGEQKLYFLAADGSSDLAVPLPKDGPVHDVQWNPRGDYFVTVAGFMPAKSTLFTAACVPKFDLGSGPYSLARWNPFGRFLVLAGFGNLPGDLAFFDKKADGKCRPMGTSRAENGVTLEWSPCGRYILAATIAPRLRVDNGIQLFKYDGTLVARSKMDVLYQAAWQPVAEGSFEDRPQSPRAAVQPEAGTSQSPAALPAQPLKRAGYIPPHLRNNPEAAAAAKASFSLARDPTDQGGKILPSGGSATRSSVSTGNLPPGASPPVSKAASKNAKRRSKKRTDDAADGMAGMSIS